MNRKPFIVYDDTNEEEEFNLKRFDDYRLKVGDSESSRLLNSKLVGEERVKLIFTNINYSFDKTDVKSVTRDWEFIEVKKNDPKDIILNPSSI